MVRFLASIVITLIANAVGLFVASLLLDGFQIQPIGFLFSVVFFTVVEVLFEPFIVKMAIQYLPALRGGIALVTTLLGLFLTTLFTDGLQIDGLGAWILAPLVIWLAVLLANVLLPLVLFKKVLQNARDNNES